MGHGTTARQPHQLISSRASGGRDWNDHDVQKQGPRCDRTLPSGGRCSRRVQRPGGPCGISHTSATTGAPQISTAVIEAGHQVATSDPMGQRSYAVFASPGGPRHLAAFDYTACGRPVAGMDSIDGDPADADCGRCAFWLRSAQEHGHLRDPGSEVRAVKGAYELRDHLKRAGGRWSPGEKAWLLSRRQLDAVQDELLVDGWAWFPYTDIHTQDGAFLKDITKWTPQRRSANHGRWRALTRRREQMMASAGAA